MQDIPRASIKELAHKIKAYQAPRFSFLLGAGASRQSGIPTAAEMIQHFKEQIILQRGPDGLKTDDEKEKWLSEQDWYRADGSAYCKCFERFEPKEIGRQRYIERIIEKREPSFGYVVLANLMAQGLINTIITTNFDDLVYSACTTFTGIRPIVYAYGVMASEMRFTAQRPKILKLHGDYLYSELKNTGKELASQDPNMMRQLGQVLSEYGLIVVGYGGGDKSVMKALSEISERQDLYWCIRRGEKNLNEDVERLLQVKGGYLVEIDGFDEMMDEVRRVVEFDVQKMLGSIDERRSQLIRLLKEFDLKYSADILGGLAEATEKPTAEEGKEKNVSALDYFLQAYKAHEAKELSKAETLYRKVIELDSSDARTYNNLGNLLDDLKRYEEAEAAYRKSIELDPGYATAYNNLGVTLKNLRRYEEAEAAYRKAIELTPGYALAYNNLGVTLKDLKRYEEAEAALRKSIELDPEDVLPYGNLCGLLRLCGKEEEALSWAEKAHRLDAKDFNLLLNLASIHKKLGNGTKASEYAEQAREVARSDDWYNLACLEALLGNTDAAIENLRRAAQEPTFNREWAAQDPDFEWIRDDPRFEEIVGGGSVE